MAIAVACLIDQKPTMDELAGVPESLRTTALAATQWLNEQQGSRFELTGLVDVDEEVTAGSDRALDLGLVLCDGELCTRAQIRVTPSARGPRFEVADAQPRDIPPLLDPPKGVRGSWLTTALERHEFVLLLFYRGLW